LTITKVAGKSRKVSAQANLEENNGIQLSPNNSIRENRLQISLPTVTTTNELPSYSTVNELASSNSFQNDSILKSNYDLYIEDKPPDYDTVVNRDQTIN
jgi:hypothetical protein